MPPLASREESDAGKDLHTRESAGMARDGLTMVCEDMLEVESCEYEAI